MTRLLEGKNAIFYGAGGGIGRGVARTFACDGARVFLAGRTRAPLERVGSLDVSFNLVSRADVQGIALVDMSVEDIERVLAPMTMLGHAPRLQDVADTAAFPGLRRARLDHGHDRQCHVRAGRSLSRRSVSPEAGRAWRLRGRSSGAAAAACRS